MAVTESQQQQAWQGAKRGSEVPPAWRRLAADNALLVILLGIIGLGGLLSEYYFTAQNIENLLRNVSIFGILALGLTPVLLIGRIDLSVGAAMIFSVALAVDVMIWMGQLFDFKVLVRGNSYNAPDAPLILLALFAGCLVGLLNGLLVTVGRIPAFIATLATMTALRGLSFLLTNGHPYYFRTPAYEWLGSARFLGIPFPMLVCLALFALLALALGCTVFGRRIYAIGGNQRMAELSGIKVGFWVVVAFLVSGLFAAIAGVLFTARLGSVDAPLAGGYELSAIAVAAIGGTSLSGGRGSPYRTLLGALVLAAILNLMNILGIGTWAQNLVLGFVVIVAVALAEHGRRRAAAS